MSERGKRYLKIGMALVFLGVLATATVFLARWVISLRDPASFARFQQWISSLGMGGWLVLLAIQYLQIVIAFVPGGPIQLVAGALFGPVGGIAVCVTGMLLATATIFPLVRRYGHRVIRLFVKEKELKQYRFLGDAKRLESLILLLFFIPGTPKDVLTYLFALTPVPLGRFLVLSTAARIPAALTSVLAGDSIAEGQWLRALICFVAITVISLGGLLLHKKIMAYYHKKQRQSSK